MNLNRAVGAMQKAGSATVFLHDFKKYHGENLPGTIWPLWPNVGPLQRLQDALLDQHSKAAAKMQAIRENVDLTSEAKSRRSAAAFDEFVMEVKDGIPTIRETAGNLYNYASQKLLPFQALAPADAVAASLDAECRAYASDLPNSERINLLMQMRQGKDPRIAAAILRGPARISGYTDEQVVKLGAAGIAVAFPEAVITLGMLAIGVRETLMNARSLALGLITDGVGIDAKAAEVQGWVDPGDGYERLAAWLEPIPLELPGKGPTAEMLKNPPKEGEAA
ncbi:hypothetical protein [Pseudomonas coronafaciens]|uniref:hypothetical protein n=1 Tax=Pseudomonas coronafaciens TaxID=53409 RepID=UPI000F3BC68E|nr:hypothetical protein [Pseudomonas coronafaciens]RMP33882.1 hypothetical protein ALQ25_03742 [Pseudomonas coronafaciens pv. atropurpurea]